MRRVTEINNNEALQELEVVALQRRVDSVLAADLAADSAEVIVRVHSCTLDSRHACDDPPNVTARRSTARKEAAKKEASEFYPRSYLGPLPPDDYEVRRYHYADGREEDVVIRKSDGKRMPMNSVRGQHPQLVIMDEAANMNFDPNTGEVIDDNYIAGDICYFPVVIPGVGWFWRCGMCHALVGDGGDLNAVEPDPVSAHSHSSGAHPITANKSGTMLTMDRGDLAAAIKDWADTQEVGRRDPYVLADLIGDTKWPFE